MHHDQKMTELDDAIALILKKVMPLEEREEVSLEDVLGRVLAQDVCSTMAVPAFDNSAMDGYALCAADLASTDIQTNDCTGKAFTVSQRIPAGAQGKILQRGTVARIFTGAPIPSGADVVIQQEHAIVQEDGRVIFTHMHTQGENIRLAGEDIQKSAVVITAGTRMSAVHIGLAASIGQARFQVLRRPKVALFVTGDELTEPGQPLKEGGIYNSNRYVLRAFLEQAGCEVSDQGIIRDSLQEVQTHLQKAAQTHDLIITSGGVSVGEEDHVKNAVEHLGTLQLWKLAFKPGKPLAFGMINKGDNVSCGHAWFLGLPGNPVASVVTFMVVVRAFLQKLSGQIVHLPRPVQLPANFTASSKGRREFWRARINDQGSIDLFPNQGSGVLTSMAWADGFVDVPAKTQVHIGDKVNYLPFSYFIN